MLKTAIVIPARFNSTRFPGKPLALLNGKTLLQRTVGNALKASEFIHSNVDVIVATDDDRIAEHSKSLGVTTVITDPAIETGTERAVASIEILGEDYDYVVNLQVDVPLLNYQNLVKLHDSMLSNKVSTLIKNLTWEELDDLRDHKTRNPRSGTTCVFDNNNKALMFSKNIIPSISGEESLRRFTSMSPVWRHIGVYGFNTTAFKCLEEEPCDFELAEDLEQLRFLSSGVKIEVVEVMPSSELGLSGIDTPEDLKLAEFLLKGKENENANEEIKESV